MDDSIESVRSEFYQEVKEILERASADFLKAEESKGDINALNSVFRGIHTVKGGAGMFEMMDVSHFCHELEGVFNALRDKKISLNTNVANIILSGIDHIGKMIVDYSLGRTASVNEELISKFKIAVEAPITEVSLKEEVCEEPKELIIEERDEIDKASVREIDAQVFRINEKKIENFGNITGELLIARNTYAYLLETAMASKSTESIEKLLKPFKANMHQFDRLTEDIYHAVFSLRMVPIKGIFQKFNRVVRDICKKQRKFIRFAIEGNDIEVDKKIADALSDPLVHLVRNSCDHGIEEPHERLDAGKNGEGKVSLTAYMEGSNIIIVIADDGKGISKKKLYEKAVKLGIDVDSLSDEALTDLIFMPGFSTKTDISDISGRGVGMDVVKTSITALSGTIKVVTEEGKGATITLSIPMKIGITTVLMIESSGSSFAIPINYILETMKVEIKKFRKNKDDLLFYYRGDVISVRKLSKILDKSDVLTNQEVSLVVLKTSKGKFGLIVDDMEKNMEIAIKPLPSSLAHIDVVSGTSIMGDGRVILVLNPEFFTAE
ncbi:MAG: chemotaxis protein CheA [Desulfobacterales bacterium]|nr:chemotaxis protein CheA [Desulfobacterales bacterium]